MPLIGVRELRSKTAEVLRRIREESAEYVITHQGKPVALILPVDTEAIEAKLIEAAKQSSGAGWETYQSLANSLRGKWPEDQNTQTSIDEIRRG
ncbi:MAG: type II toxin-antitoxin system Phd/YefM family antitoxin [Anaerolineales bacterium]|nr:type II toxin-antitoxin system Phd/YefM family antitoxin [Chloroflexota bacterium]MBL7161441.1 type II toxin-antitoxin system Phd/YefM family antitoxin [Anaerolineales bacterium]